MRSIYKKILSAKENGEKLLAILLDPDKLSLPEVETLVRKIDKNKADFIFVGGSTVKKGVSDAIIREVKKFTNTPVILFPGDHSQITAQADAVLFLNLLSGRNPEYLIEQQLKSVPLLQKTNLEVIPTAYILIDGGVETAVQKVSKTQPISPKNIEKITNTACAGMYMGNHLVYLEAGSGAKYSIDQKIITAVRNKIDLPLIVGGGVKTKDQLDTAFRSGADLVVIGNGFEENNTILSKILKNESIC